MGRTTALRRELKRRFYPFAENRGFVVDTSGGPGFIVFRRFGPTSIDVFDIQWEKYGTPRFVVNFGQCEPDGVVHFGESIASSEVLPSMSNARGRLQPNPRYGGTTRRWFCQDRDLLSRVVLRRPDRPAADVVDELIALFPEMDRWFQRRERAPHLQL